MRELGNECCLTGLEVYRVECAITLGIVCCPVEGVVVLVDAATLCIALLRRRCYVHTGRSHLGFFTSEGVQLVEHTVGSHSVDALLRAYTHCHELVLRRSDCGALHLVVVDDTELERRKVAGIELTIHLAGELACSGGCSD